MNRSFSAQHLSTPCRHHAALLLEARVGLSPTSTKIGFVCEEARMRSATQLLLSTRTSKETPRNCPSARIFCTLIRNVRQPCSGSSGSAGPGVTFTRISGLMVKLIRHCGSSISWMLRVERSSWVALRILASSHTNPIFVLVGDRPIRASSKSAEWCLRGVDKCWAEKERFIKPDEMTSAKDAYEHARSTYRRLLAECQSSGPTSAEAKSGQ